ncbi:MAG TPA: glucodextranase DOMON-like domain-containing protein [Thermoanaerobaculia bacterium]
MHRSRTTLFLSGLVAIFLVAIVLAAPAFGAKEIFKLTDPRGDDYGDGQYVYPDNSDFGRGDLDLLSLTARQEGQGTRFEATFAKPIKLPGREIIDGLGTELVEAARFGFYLQNLDIYIDTDRAPGSGGLTMLPGRNAEIDPAFAWEKAIILTPRPHEAKAELKRMLVKILNEDAQKEGSTITNEEVEALKRQIPVDVDQRVFFPTEIRVRGQKISFFVPGIFLGGPAKAAWSYVVATSGADLLQSFDLARMMGRPSGGRALMILPVSPGRWAERFGGGRDGATNQPPLIDVIVPKGQTQEKLMSDFDSRAKRPVVLPGVVPAEQK